jgi:hypothetical protein
MENRARYWVLVGLLAALASCAPDTSAPALNTSARITPVAVLPSQTTEETATAEPFVDVACLDCHTDQARLMELAVEVEKAETLSEGPG